MTTDQEFSVELQTAQSLSEILDGVAQEIDTKTGVERKAEIAEALRVSDFEVMEDLQKKMETFVYHIMANETEPGYAGLLTPAELYSLMVEFLDRDDIRKLLDIRYQDIRERVFSHITEDNKRKGVSDPEYAPSEAIVPKLGRRFTREGGKAKVILDFDKLREHFTDEQNEQVFRTVVIPEHIETKLNEDALVALVQEDPGLLDVIKDCVVQVGRTPVSFHVRPISKEH